METFKTIDEFIEIAGEALRSHPVKDGEIITFPLDNLGHDEVGFEITEERLNELFKLLSSMNEIDDSTIVNINTYEILVSDESALPRLREMGGDGITLRDEENKLTYTLSKPSDSYLIFLLYKLSKIAPIRFSLDPIFLRQRVRRRANFGNGEGEAFDKNVLNALKLLSPRLLTLRIESEKQKQTSEFVKYANSFFFQLSYNLDIPIVPQRYLDELVRRGRITRVRRSKLEEMEAPKRIYLPDLVYHYQLAVASDSPPLEYLSYYHILEYFFEAVFNDDLIQKVTKTITEPDFSYKRKKDIKKLIDEIGKSLKYRSENMTFSEIEALKLTLERFVRPNDLGEKIRNYDESLVDYFKTNQVAFSAGDTFDIENGDSGKIFRQIAARIYKTRNAIVHSKESEKSRYIPFEHDKLIVKEVPLLRFIAELVIIESSTIVN
jgi:hypothetical protein